MNETKTLPTINSIYIPSDGKKKKRERKGSCYVPGKLH